ncbi:MAG: hypothetical protein MI745_13535 [Pseudomonadales bacterium]|nr:hypothetical protein [Pseudomonadales bacterium]
MKRLLRKLFSPILNPFESGEDNYAYRPSHRKILVAVGLLFLILSLGSLAMVIRASLYGGLIPVVFFLLVAVVCLVVALLGSDKAVARIWKSK